MTFLDLASLGCGRYEGGENPHSLASALCAVHLMIGRKQAHYNHRGSIIAFCGTYIQSINTFWHISQLYTFFSLLIGS